MRELRLAKCVAAWLGVVLVSIAQPAWGAAACSSLITTSLSAWETSVGGATLHSANLSCLSLTEVALKPPSVDSFAEPAFGQITISRPAAGEAAPVSLANVSMQTDCATVQQYQQYICRLRLSELAGAFEISSPYWIYLHSWQSSVVSSQAVNVTCVPPADSSSSPPEGRQLPACLATGVTSGTALLAALDWLQRVQGTPEQQTRDVLIVLRQDVAFLESDVAPYWPMGLSVTTNVTIAAPLSTALTVLDFHNYVNVLSLSQWPRTYITFFGLAMVNLPTYFFPFVSQRLHLFGMLQSSLWFVNRRSVAPAQLTIQSSTLVISYDSFAFWVYWLKLKNSPDPSLQALASWTTLAPVNLNDADSGHLLLADTYAPVTTWLNTSMANPMVYPVICNQIGLPAITDNFNIPVPSLFQVSSVSDIQVAANKTIGDIWTRQYGQLIILRANISGNSTPSMLPHPSANYRAPPASPLAHPSAPPPPPPSPGPQMESWGLPMPVPLQVPTTFTVWPNFTACWDMRQSTNLVAHTAASPITVRNLSLMNLPPTYAAGMDPTMVLVTGLWPLVVASDSPGSTSYTTLEDVTLYVPTAELQLYFSAASLTPPGAPPGHLNLSARGRSFMEEWMSQSDLVSYGPHWMFYTTLVTSRFKGTNVNLTDAVPPACADFEAMEVVDSNYALFTTNADEGSSGLAPWAIGLIAGLVGAAALAAAASAFLVVRRRRDALRRDLFAGSSASSLKFLGVGGTPEAARALSTATTNSNIMLMAQGSLGLPGSDYNCKGDGRRDTGSTIPSSYPHQACGSKGSGQPDDSFSHMFDANMIDGRGPNDKHVDPETMINRLARQNSGLQDEQLEIMGVLGRGGFGIVYKGRWKGLLVAAKVMIVHEENHESAQSQMLEAMISTSLSHPNIVSTYKYDLKRLSSTPDAISFPSMAKNGRSLEVCGASAWQLLILQELCAGGTLRQMIDADSLAYEQFGTGNRMPILAHILQLALDVALGLQHLHYKNVVHADLTPKNVLLQTATGPRPDGLKWSAKVADFGLSVACEAGRSHVSRRFAGTPFYIAPETQHEGIVSKQSDVFALGILLSEMMMGPLKPARQRARASLPSSGDDLVTRIDEHLAECSPSGGASSAAATSPAASAAPLLAGDQETGGSMNIGGAIARQESLGWSAAASGRSPAGHEAGREGRSGGGGSSQVAPAGAAVVAMSLAPEEPGQRDVAGGTGSTTGGGGTGGGRTAGGTGDGGVGGETEGGCSSQSSGLMGSARASLPLPSSCPPQYAALVTECLSPMPFKRPSIATVVQVLRGLVMDHGGGSSAILSEFSFGSSTGIGSAGPSLLPTLSE